VSVGTTSTWVRRDRNDRRRSASGEGLPRTVGAPATRALTAAGYTRLSQLAGVPEAHLRTLHGVGPMAIARLRAALEEQGLSSG
jgi:hypothetical protein